MLETTGKMPRHLDRLPFHVESAVCYYDHYVLAATRSATTTLPEMRDIQETRDIVYRYDTGHDIISDVLI